MGFNICSIQEKGLVDRFHSLKVKGEIIEEKDAAAFRRPA